MTSFAPEEFAPEEFVGGGQICNDEYPSKNSKNVDFDCIMNAFFDERNNCNLSSVREVVSKKIQTYTFKPIQLQLWQEHLMV